MLLRWGGVETVVAGTAQVCCAESKGILATLEFRGKWDRTGGIFVLEAEDREVLEMHLPSGWTEDAVYYSETLGGHAKGQRCSIYY